MINQNLDPIYQDLDFSLFMPELPEVETIRSDLEKRIVGEKISGLEIRDQKLLEKGSSWKGIEGRRVKGLERRGKLLILVLEKEIFILVHLKMTGQLVYQDGKELVAGGHSLDKSDLFQGVGGELPNKHTRAIIHFQSGAVLFFNDLRRFGYLKPVTKQEKEEKLTEFGPEPLMPDFDLLDFQKKLKKRKIAVKKALLDQKLVAGLGNIYVDEVLFLSGIRPERSAESLKSNEIKALYSAIIKILKQGVKYRGTTFSDYVDARGKAGNFSRFLKVYNRGGRPCQRCDGSIKKIKLAGRGTHYCPGCQK